MDVNAEGPVNIDTTEVQEIRGRQFQVEHHPGGLYGDFTMYRFTENGREPFTTVYERPHTALDFYGVNFNMSNNPSSRFTSHRTVRLYTETGTIAIDGNIFRRRINGEKIEEEITTNQRLYEILTEEFNMIVPKIGFNAAFPRLWF